MNIAAYFPGMFVLATILVWGIARLVLVPLGLVRAAYYVSRVSTLLWSKDMMGGALTSAALALVHVRGDREATDEAWIEGKLGTSIAMRPGTILAAALLAARRGDVPMARALLRGAIAFDPAVTPKYARHVACGWLAAEAVERGAYDEAAAIGQKLGEDGRVAWLIGGIAARLAGTADRPTRWNLVLRWLLAPSRTRTWRWVERALAAEEGPDLSVEPAVCVPPIGGDLLGRALAAHAALLRAPSITAADVCRVGRAWDEAFADPSLETGVADRAALLGTTRSSIEVIATFRDAVEDDLYRALRAHDLGLDDAVEEVGEIAGAAQRRMRDELLSAVETMSDAIKRRVEEKRALSPIDEWREWTNVRAAYENGVRLAGAEWRYLAFTKVEHDVCALGVWLFNTRGERAVGNALFRWLLSESEAVGDAWGGELYRKNVACGAE